MTAGLSQPATVVIGRTHGVANLLLRLKLPSLYVSLLLLVGLPFLHLLDLFLLLLIPLLLILLRRLALIGKNRGAKQDKNKQQQLYDGLHFSSPADELVAAVVHLE